MFFGCRCAAFLCMRRIREIYLSLKDCCNIRRRLLHIARRRCERLGVLQRSWRVRMGMQGRTLNTIVIECMVNWMLVPLIFIFIRRRLFFSSRKRVAVAFPLQTLFWVDKIRKLSPTSSLLVFSLANSSNLFYESAMTSMSYNRNQSGLQLESNWPFIRKLLLLLMINSIILMKNHCLDCGPGFFAMCIRASVG